MNTSAIAQNQQLSLWNDDDTGGYVHIKDVASRLNVSVSTVHNWQKTGLLQSISANVVTKKSVSAFVSTYVGNSKLSSRANKQHKHTVSFSPKESQNNLTGEAKGQLYETSIPENIRNREGVYYTPQSIVSDMFDCIGNLDFADKLILEPCCGSGNFIIEAIRRGAHPNNIYAFDTDETAIQLTRQRIQELTGLEAPHIQCRDFLSIANTLHQKFDLIFTNPPWGKKYPKEAKERFADIYHAKSSKDSCSLFFFACMSLLKKDGVLGLLLPEAFFNITTFEEARSHALRYQILALKDYGKPFKGILSRAQGIVLSNRAPEHQHEIQCSFDGSSFNRQQQSLAKTPKHIFNFWVTTPEANIIEHLYNQPHITLKGKAMWGLGIVTGDNKKNLSSQPQDNRVQIVRGKDITPEAIKDSGLYIDRDLSHCQQVAPLYLYQSPEKLIYRFISDKLVFYADHHQRYILNSANMLVPDRDFPITCTQLAQLLNTKLFTWLFQKIFRTHKVLRSDIELLPIYAGFFKTGEEHFEERKLLDYLGIIIKDGAYRTKE